MTARVLIATAACALALAPGFAKAQSVDAHTYTRHHAACMAAVDAVDHVNESVYCGMAAEELSLIIPEAPASVRPTLTLQRVYLLVFAATGNEDFDPGKARSLYLSALDSVRDLIGSDALHGEQLDHAQNVSAYISSRLEASL